MKVYGNRKSKHADYVGATQSANSQSLLTALRKAIYFDRNENQTHGQFVIECKKSNNRNFTCVNPGVDDQHVPMAKFLSTYAASGSNRIG